jgi:hypothetical protein
MLRPTFSSALTFVSSATPLRLTQLSEWIEIFWRSFFTFVIR